MRTKIKFCGITRVGDAEAAVDAGADAIGLIFVPSADRRVSVELAEMIVQAVGPFTTVVGVFADTAVDEIRRITSRLAIGTVQLHGHEPASMLIALSDLRIIKVLRLDDETADVGWFRDRRRITTACCWTAQPVDQASRPIGPVTSRFFGAGPSSAAANSGRRAAAGHRRRLVRRFSPAAVDVSSGIESARGIKSVEKMRAFVAAVRAADADESA